MTEKHFIGENSERTYTQKELDDAVNQARCEAYDRAKSEASQIQVKYNALRHMLCDLSAVFGAGDS